MLDCTDVKVIKAAIRDTCPRCAPGETCPVADLDAHARAVALSERLLERIVSNVVPELLADQQYRRELVGHAWRLAQEHAQEVRT